MHTLALLLVGSSAAASPPLRSNSTYMNCGSTSLCGVLTLETGLGDGTYSHDVPTTHGLWPETGSYGSSKCVAPTSSTSDPISVYSCYEQSGESKSSLISFESHEWEKHGQCAGVKDADDFFTQVCSLSTAPLKVMTQTRSGGATSLSSFQSALEDAGYPVFATDSDFSQVLLSACAGSDGRWVLSSVSDFASKCGRSSTEESDCHLLILSSPLTRPAFDSLQGQLCPLLPHAIEPVHAQHPRALL